MYVSFFAGRSPNSVVLPKTKHTNYIQMALLGGFRDDVGPQISSHIELT